MSAVRNNIEVGEPRNSRGPSRSFIAKWVEGKKSEHGSNYSTFLFLIPTVVGLIQVKDLFETHPTNMWISVAALFIFCLSHATMKKINQTEYETRYSQIIDSFRVLSGELVVVSVLSIFLPHRLRWLFFVIWALDLLAACIVAHHIFNFKDTWIYLGVMKAFQSVCNNILDRFIERITVQRDVLPR